MDLASYFARVGYRGAAQPTLATLSALHRAHLLHIPYENLDIHLGRRLGLEERAIFSKLVRDRRGGWCFEMNGLFAAVLEELGFTVWRLAGTVQRPGVTPTEGDHLVLVVEIDQRRYLADVGFGDGLWDPIPLEEGTHRQRFLDLRLERAGDTWIFHNHPHGGAQRFDFRLERRALTDFADRCHELQTSPTSGFVQRTVCQRFTETGIVTLRGAVLRTASAGGLREEVVADGTQYARILREQFGLAIPEARELWERVWERHLAWVQATAGSDTTPGVNGS